MEGEADVVPVAEEVRCLVSVRRVSVRDSEQNTGLVPPGLYMHMGISYSTKSCENIGWRE